MVWTCAVCVRACCGGERNRSRAVTRQRVVSLWRVVFWSCQRGFEEVLNAKDSEHSHAEILATFVDGLLRGKKGAVSLSESQIDDFVQDTMKLFELLTVCSRLAVECVACAGTSYIRAYVLHGVQDKDIFRDHYRVMLAKRLLSQKSFSIDAGV